MSRDDKYLEFCGASMESLKKINLENVDINKAFELACANGNLDSAKFLLENDSNLKIELWSESLYLGICKFGRTEILEFLFSAGTYFDINFKDDLMFRLACEYGHLDMAKFILSLDKNINICAMHDWAFKHASINRHKNVVEFLLSLLNQARHEFHYYEDGEYYILKPLHPVGDEKEHYVVFCNSKIYCRSEKYLANCLKKYEAHYLSHTLI